MDTNKINIVFLPHRRWNFTNLQLKIFERIKEFYHLTICCLILPMQDDSDSHQNALRLSEQATKIGMSNTVVTVKCDPMQNYILKLKEATNLPFKYSLKLDEDIFTSPYVYEFMHKNRTLLDNDQNFILTPALSSGIPTCDYFINEQFSIQDQAKIYQAFSQTLIPSNLWGADFSELNNLLSRGYRKDDYYNEVARVKHHYKGIHPIRVDKKSQIILNDLIIENINKFHETPELKIIDLNEPYFCNSTFLIKTEEWRNILDNKSRFVDAFDEVPVNRYWKKTGKKILCISNSFSIHTMYNTLINRFDTNIMNEYENGFYSKIEKGIGY